MNNSLADSKTLTRLLLICLAVILGLCLILGDGDDDATAVFNQVYAIKRVETDENIYAVCADCGRGTNVKDAVSLVNTATSLGIKICLFISADHAAFNSEELRAVADKCELGLLIEQDMSSTGKKEIMRTIAEYNEKIYESCGVYPRFVKYVGEDAPTVYETVRAYGQYAVEGSRDSVSAGSVWSMGEVDSSSGRILTNTAAACAGSGLLPVSLGELLLDIDIQADMEGVQRE